MYNHLESTIEKYMQYKAEFPSSSLLIPIESIFNDLFLIIRTFNDSAAIPEEEIMEHTDHRSIDSVRKFQHQSEEMC